MIETTQTSLDALVSPSREIKAKIDLFDGTTKKATFTGSDNIKKFQIERAGEEGKFFGFGIGQKLELELLDKDRELNIVKGNTFDIYLTADTTYTKILSCEVDSIKRDEKTNSLTISAHDTLYKAAGYQVKDLTLTKPYTIKQFCEACGAKLGVSVKGINTFTLSYPNGANFDGAETLREALDMVAEATQTIYFMDSTNAMVFKKLDKAGPSLLTIDKNIYFEYKNNGPRVLKTICSTNELGDDVSESGTTGDATQFVRDNAFWELRDDITDLVHNAVVAVGGLSISQFECRWRGNFYLEIGDKIQILGKDNSSAITYLLNDTLVYNGGLNQTSSWKYKDSGETASNPTNLGEAIKQTYAKVDKQNKEITLLASEVRTQTETIKKTVKQVDVEYYLSTSTSTPTGGTWSTEAPPWEENKYMWSRQKITYTDGTFAIRNATCIAGAKGADGKPGSDGAPGRGITSITTEYYISTSETELVGGSWSENQPVWEEGKYIWTRSKIVYNNPTSTEYTTEVCDAAWKEINAIQGEQKTLITDVAELKVAKDSITASVSQITENQSGLNSALTDLQNAFTDQNKINDEQFDTLTQKVESSMTADQVHLAISTELSKGVDKVTTSTGFTFNEAGLTISKSDSEISTNIDEDGMSIYKNNEEVLTADNTGVTQINATIKQYLIVGKNSRFEDYGSDRTGCFWIGS
jgi:hypothetical protein